MGTLIKSVRINDKYSHSLILQTNSDPVFHMLYDKRHGLFRGSCITIERCLLPCYYRSILESYL